MEFADQLAHAVGVPGPESEAVAYQHAWWSWGRIRTLMSSVTAFLDAAGCPKGERIGLVMSNRPEHVAAALAILASGRCLTVLGGIQPPSALADQLAGCAPAVLVGSPEVVRAPDVRNALADIGCGSGELTTEGVAATPLTESAAGLASTRTASTRTASTRTAGSRTASAAGSGAADSRTPAIEISSSGTTGPPSTVALSARQLEASLRASGQYRTRTGRSRTTVVAHPIEHIAGLWALLGAVLSGRRIVLLPRFEVGPWVEAVDRYGIRAAFLVPTALRDILDARVPPHRLRSLSLLSTGASHCPVEVADEFWRRHRVPVLMTYGATEFAGAIAGWTRQLHADWWRTKAGSAGRPYPGVGLRVVDATGRALPAGATGQLEVRSDQASETGAWTRTADLAHLDSDGFLWISGRVGTVVDRGGFKISPERIERVLRDHHEVRDSAVVGVPDSRLGAVPVAAVESGPGRPCPGEQALLEHCRARLAPYETPVRIVCRELPRTPSGKIDRPAVERLLRTPE